MTEINKSRVSGTADMFIVLARSEQPSLELVYSLACLGLHVVHVPLIETKPLPLDTRLRTQLSSARDACWNIFVSRAAVRAVAQLSPDLIRGARNLAAVGAQSAQNLIAEGAAFVLQPETSEGAEALLKHPQLMQVQQQLIRIFCARDGLPLLTDTLQSRGALVESVYCYTRTPAEIPEPERAHCRKAVLVYVGSRAFLQRFHEIVAPLTSAIVLAPSARVVSAAISAGFQAYRCESTQDLDLLRTLSSLRRIW